MQAEYGGPDVLHIGSAPVPAPGKGQAQVAVRAAGVDQGVWHLVTGRPTVVRLGIGLLRPRRRVPGTDLAGVVTAVGPEMRGVAVGDEVFGTGRGTYADYAVSDADRLAPKPANLTFEQAAAVPVSAEAALIALRDEARVEPGQRVLVLGASGGVGTFAVQLARHFGATVTAVCSAAKAEAVRSLGAADVIDYRAGDPLAEAGHYDVVLDIAGGHPLRRLRRALTPTGTLVVIGVGTTGFTGGLGRMGRAALWSPFVAQRLRPLSAAERREDLEWLTPLLESGEIRPVVDRVLPMVAAGDALGLMEAGEVTGKVVLSNGGVP